MEYQRVVQLYSGVGRTCPVCNWLPPGDNEDWLEEQTTHLLGHGWDLLHVGQQSLVDDGEVIQQTTVIFGEPGTRRSKGAADRANAPAPLVNRFAGQAWVFEECDCQYDPSLMRHFHTDIQDTEGEAWQQLLALIDEAAEDGREAFVPGHEMPAELWSQIVTLPPSIGKLSAVKVLNLYGSNLVMVPPEIGELKNLERFTPYTSRRLHWFPFEITRCTRLVDSTVSTRNLYGNYKYRTPFPQLPAELPNGSTPDCCSVCRGPLPPSGAIQAWISLVVATDVLPLLVHSCSEECIRNLPEPALKNHLNHPHQGGPEVVQPKARDLELDS